MKSATKDTQSPLPNSTLEEAVHIPKENQIRRKGMPWKTIASLSLLTVFLYLSQLDDNRSGFVGLELATKETVSKTASIFHLDTTAAGTAPTTSSGISIYLPGFVWLDRALQASNRKAAARLFQSQWESGQGVWNVEFKQPQLQITRKYTPLPPSWVTDDNGITQQKERDDYMRFLIRHDKLGEVSNYLYGLPLGTSIEIGTPNMEHRCPPEAKQVVFFAGGTGIAPALQIAHCMFRAKPPTPEQMANPANPPPQDVKLHILWANRTRDDCIGGVNNEVPQSSPLPFSLSLLQSSWSELFKSKTVSTPPTPELAPAATVFDKTPLSSEEKSLIVRELEALKKTYPGQVTVEYYVDEEKTRIDKAAIARALARFEQGDAAREGGLGSRAQGQIFVSGPEGFIAYLAGPKSSDRGRDLQGPLGGALRSTLAQSPLEVSVTKI